MTTRYLVHNPDTDVFMKYTLAGAYDSNIALILSVGDSRETSHERMAEIPQSDRGVRPGATSTSITVWYIVLNRTVHVGQRRFIVPYLTAVGELAAGAQKIDLRSAYTKRYRKSAGAVLEAKKR